MATLTNEQWQIILTACQRIMLDPTESPRRRRIASSTYWGMGRVHHPAMPIDQSGAQPILGNHRGGHFMQTTIDYKGSPDRA